MNQRKTFIFVGTTAELIKLIPVIKELKKRKIKFTIIASRQNDIHFDEFKEITKDIQIVLAVTPKSKKSSVFGFIFWSIRTFFSLLIGMRSNFAGLNKSNSYFIVHGDTVSSLMGSFVASIYGLKLVHVESGLRSFHFFEPFPEELCRYFVSRLADIHFCPNQWSVNNLRQVKGEKINTFENTLIESYYASLKAKVNNSFIAKLIESKKKYFVLVIHRQEHVVFEKSKTTKLLKNIFEHIPQNMKCIFLVHDLSKQFILNIRENTPHIYRKNIITINRLPYAHFLRLLYNSEFVLTDGGSNQEELYYMGKPCLLLRNYTERQEGINRNVIISKNNSKMISNFIQSYKKYIRPQVVIDKSPSQIIVDHLFHI